VLERNLRQGEDERIAWAIDTTPWGSAPASVVVVVKNLTTVLDVTGSTTTGTASVVGNVITLPTLHSLVAGNRYRIEVRFVSGANTFETWFEIQAEI
jgi:hypothetical protein